MNIAMKDCLAILYPACRQPVIAKFVCIYGELRFFSACSPGSVYLGPKPGQQVEKTEHTKKYKKNIAMIDCLITLYPA